ncbi:MAG TPA: Rid family detoxifying hydrolase [Patescibacteria group bacterium]|nr:Rid family detoxifying hydrolase [Patescibacteria group bacterium]
MRKEIIVVDKLPRPPMPYSHCVKAGNFLFIAGQVGVDFTNGKLKGNSIREQTEQALTNMTDILKAAGSSMEDVVKTTVFISDFKDFDEMNEVYGRFFPINQPARSTVQVVLYDGFKVEIEATAIISS